jgi:hypothetical protein
MPSHLHEALLLLFRNRPALAPELLREALHVQLPDYTDVRIDSADLTDIQPAEYRADLVVLLLRDTPVLGIVLEVQLSSDEDKRYAWPAYVANLRARIRCPVCLLVIAADEGVARWACKAVELGGGNRFVPCVLGPSGVPEITDEKRAIDDPELAVLSAMAHGRDPNTAKAAHIALLAQMVSLGLDAERSTLYCDLILHSLPEAARRALQTMDTSKYEYQSEFARRYFGQGKAAGKAEGRVVGRVEGRVEIILRLLATRYGILSAAVEARVRGAGSAELDSVAERVLTASSLEEALGLPGGSMCVPR